METLLVLLKEGLTSGVLSMARIACILVPIMVIVEIARHFNILEAVSTRIQGLLRLLSLPKEAAFPLVAGMFFGIIYGAALIIDASREGSLQKRDLMLIGIFLCINHSIIEDTFIFTVFGSNPLIIFVARLLLAVVITRLAALALDYRAGRKKVKMEAGG